MFIIYVKVPVPNFLAKSESVSMGPRVQFIWNDPLTKSSYGENVKIIIIIITIIIIIIIIVIIIFC